MDTSSLDSFKLDEESAIEQSPNNVTFTEKTRHKRTLSFHGKPNVLHSIKSQPETVLPTAFRTISHTIDDTIQSKYETVVDEKSQTFFDAIWHTETAKEVANKLGTSLTRGLDSAAITPLQKQYGYNVQPKPGSNWIRKYFMYLFGGFGTLLFVGGILVIICYKPLGDPPAVANLALGIVLLAVFLIQALFNWYQDFASSRVMDSIHNMLPVEVAVTRDGSYLTIEGKNLVPGDLIKLVNGVKVPADVRIIECSENLAFDRSILTGESKPVVGSMQPSSNPNFLESECIALQGTYCVSGTGMGIVVNIGSSTVFGTIAKLAARPKRGLTTLQWEILRFVLIVVVVIVVIIVIIVVLWAAWLRKDYPDWISVPVLIVDIVSVAVAFIPEGLPIALTTCLMITALKMKEHKILCKSLAVIETLGSVSVLCSDKTGTLTANKMSVTSQHAGINTDTDWDQLTLIGALCNESTMDSKGEVVEGNATDKAILQFSYDNANLDIKGYALIKTISFNSKFKFMIKLYQFGNEYLLTIKGAPDILIDRCSTYIVDGEERPFDDTCKASIAGVQMKWSEQGERVVMMAYKRLPIDTYTEEQLLSVSELTLVGIVGISDPLRDRIPEVVHTLKEAGVKVLMVTGDFAATALAIARNCGIITSSYVDTIDELSYDGGSLVINGPDMFRLSEVDWDKLCNYREIVFSRTTPEQKLKIVKEFQSRKQVVGMTGDGINDSPSLKQADVGISMADGTEVAKEASDLILLESFISIVEALKFGRLVFENLRKIICYLLPAGTYAELWAILINVIFGLPQALSSFLMIIICCWTDCIASICLTYEKPEKNLLKKKPRSVSGEKLVDWKLFLHSYFTVGTYYTFTSMLLAFLNFQRRGVRFSDMTLKYGQYPDPDLVNSIAGQSSSIYFINCMILQFFNSMACRTRVLSIFQQAMNWRLICAIPFIFGTSFIWSYIPALQPVLTSDTVPVQFFFISLGFGCVVLIYDEIRKFFVRKYPTGVLAKIAW